MVRLASRVVTRCRRTWALLILPAVILSLAAAPVQAQIERDILDIDYIQRRFFFLVHPLDPFLTGEQPNLADPNWVGPPVVSNLTIWFDDRQLNPTAVPGLLHLDPSGIEPPAADWPDPVAGRFTPLVEGVDYHIREDLFEGEYLQRRFRYPIVDMVRPISSQVRLGATFTATYTMPDRTTRTLRYGDTNAEPVAMKALYGGAGLVATSNGVYQEEDPWYPIRELELRNIYGLGFRGDWRQEIEVERFGATHLPGAPNTTFLRMLGVDKEGADGAPGFDGAIDDQFILPAEGLLVLPDLRPFGPLDGDTAWPFLWMDLVPPTDGDALDVRGALFFDEWANRAPYQKANPTGFDAQYTIVVRAEPIIALDLSQTVRPNPFRDSVEIVLSVDQATTINSRIYSATGRLVDEQRYSLGNAANVVMRWDGRDLRRNLLPSGVYYLHLATRGRVETRKLLLLR